MNPDQTETKDLNTDIDYEKRIESDRPAPPLDLRLDLSSTDSLSPPLTLVPPDDYIDDPDYPDHDWAPNRGTLGAASAYISVELMGICGLVFFQSLLRNTLTPLGVINYTGAQDPRFTTGTVLLFSGLYGVTIFSLLIERALANRGRAVRMSLQAFNVAYFAATPLVGYFSKITPVLESDSIPLYMMQPLAYVVYIICALVYRFRGRPKWG